MPRKSKRHDPVDAPIDGDYAHDVILNKNEDEFDYVITDPEDVPRIRMRGGAVLLRADAGETKPAWDMGDASDPDFRLGTQVVMVIPKEKNARYHAIAQTRNDQRNKVHKAAARKSGGKYNVEKGIV